MTDFNDKIKALLAFSASFEEFKSELETKLNQLSEPTDLSGLVKKDELAKSVDELKEDIKAAKFDAFAFDSARRTFGEEIAVLKSFVDKSFNELRKELEALKDSGDIAKLENELKSYIDKEFRKLKGGNNG